MDSVDNFDADQELERLKTHKKLIRKSRLRVSRLDRYHGELKALKNAGATAADLQRWLREKRIKVHLSTVTRWLEKHRG